MSRLVFDIGGTNMRMALAEEGTVHSLEKIPTPSHPEEAVTQLDAFLASVQASPVDIVGGIAGIITQGTVSDSPNLPAWNGFGFGTALAKLIGVPVQVRNDAEIAAFGEAVRGAGREYERVGYLTVGTGVGGALIVHKTLPSEDEVYEPGRLILDTKNNRSFERFVGGAALAAEFGMAARDLPRSLYAERTAYLATGISRVIDLWSPDVLILNGSLIDDDTGYRIADLLDAVHEKKGDDHVPPIVRASLGDLSALEGAAAL